MNIHAKFCDLCKSDGDLVLAVCRYQGDVGRWFEACDVHQEQVEGYGLPTVQFQFPGDVDPLDFE